MIFYLVKAAISSFLATIGFGVLFNVHDEKLIGAGITGAFGGVAYKICILFGMSEVMSNLAGAIALAICAECMARILKSPVTSFIACALIPLVPGGGLYKMMLEIINGTTYLAMNTLLETVSIAGVLAIGILVVSTIFKFVHIKK